jgi:predicted transcriptional regulator
MNINITLYQVTPTQYNINLILHAEEKTSPTFTFTHEFAKMLNVSEEDLITALKNAGGRTAKHPYGKLLTFSTTKKGQEFINNYLEPLAIMSILSS